jgi:two-component system response regulator DesR
VVPAALDALPDVALLDIEMPGGDGLNAAAALKESLPSCRVIILTTFGRAGYLRRAMESGAVGFLLKDAPASELAAAIRRVMVGERVVDPGLAAAALSEGESPLTAREREVLELLARGHSNAEIAQALVVSEATVKTHVGHVLTKLGARDRVQAVIFAYESGVVGRGRPDSDSVAAT